MESLENTHFFWWMSLLFHGHRTDAHARNGSPRSSARSRGARINHHSLFILLTPSRIGSPRAALLCIPDSKVLFSHHSHSPSPTLCLLNVPLLLINALRTAVSRIWSSETRKSSPGVQHSSETRVQYMHAISVQDAAYSKAGQAEQSTHLAPTKSPLDLWDPPALEPAQEHRPHPRLAGPSSAMW